MRLARLASFVLSSILCCSSCLAQQNSALARLELLDHLAGTWMLDGVIAGKHTIHDVQANWVLNREYLQLHEISRDKNPGGEAAYEAIVYISWDDKAHQYVCLWLDSTVGGGLSAEGLAHAKPAGDSIPFIFAISPADQIRTTFTYDRTRDAWQWLIDNVENGKERRFANVKLTRVK